MVVSAVIGFRNVSIVIWSVFLFVIKRLIKLIFSFSSYVNLHLSCLLILCKQFNISSAVIFWLSKIINASSTCLLLKTIFLLSSIYLSMRLSLNWSNISATSPEIGEPIANPALVRFVEGISILKVILCDYCL